MDDYIAKGAQKWKIHRNRALFSGKKSHQFYFNVVMEEKLWTNRQGFFKCGKDQKMWSVFLQKTIFCWKFQKSMSFVHKNLFFERKNGNWIDESTSVPNWINVTVHSRIKLTPTKAYLRKWRMCLQKTSAKPERRIPNVQLNELVSTTHDRSISSKGNNKKWSLELNKYTSHWSFYSKLPPKLFARELYGSLDKTDGIDEEGKYWG